MTIVSNKVEEITRKNWIDWMKVIGITAVVWGHFFPEGMSDFIYAFNVPVFFVISGYLTKENRGMRLPSDWLYHISYWRCSRWLDSSSSISLTARRCGHCCMSSRVSTTITAYRAATICGSSIH